MDGPAFPMLVADQLNRVDALSGCDQWSMIQRAAGYLVRSGPVTQQDRWEEDGGYSPFTLAAEIAGLLAAADFAEEKGDYGLASYLRRQQTHGTKPLNVGPMLQERNSRNASESTGTTSESLLRILPTLSFQVQHLSLFEIVP